MSVQIPTPDVIRDWPVTVDVPTAASAWGIGRRQAYEFARCGRFPVPVLRIGTKLRVTRASVMAALGIPELAPKVVSASREAA